VQQFINSKWAADYGVVPAMRDQDKINAARSTLPKCVFDAAACAPGLLALREWSFKWSDDRRTYSTAPDHNWASHAADAFCYGAAMLRDHVATKLPPALPTVAAETFKLNDLWADRERFNQRNRLT
jgi:phage terminase large subunit